jgi:CheY-like chemotaxis protein
MKILIIEDEILIQKSLQKLLEKRGASVDCSSSGRDAITKISVNNYDRIICDLMLQDISGFDVIEESKKKYTLEQIGKIFVIITAYSSQQVMNKAKAYNCSVLNKPFESMSKAIEIFMDIKA